MDVRFQRPWEQWRALTQAGKRPAEFLGGCPDETLVELLAAQDEGSALERNVIATELLNRLARLHRGVDTHGGRVLDLIDRNESLAKEAETATREATQKARSAISSVAKVAEVDRVLRREMETFEADIHRSSRHGKDQKGHGDW